MNIKSLGGSVATLCNWLTAWGVTMTANLLMSWSEGGSLFSLSVSCASFCLYFMRYYIVIIFSTGTFTIYALVSAFTVVFVKLWVPETKGKTLEEIQTSFR